MQKIYKTINRGLPATDAEFIFNISLKAIPNKYMMIRAIRTGERKENITILISNISENFQSLIT